MKPVKIGSEIWPIFKLLEPILLQKIGFESPGSRPQFWWIFIEKSPGHFLADFLHLELNPQQAKLVC